MPDYRSKGTVKTTFRSSNLNTLCIASLAKAIPKDLFVDRSFSEPPKAKVKIA